MDWAAEQNVKHFRAMLESESDPARRGTIERLLAEEKAKLKGDWESRAGTEADPVDIDLGTPHR
jgi:hypothetical protein